VLGALCCCLTHEHCCELRRDLPAATLPHPRTDCHALSTDEQARAQRAPDHTCPTKRLDCSRPTVSFSGWRPVHSIRVGAARQSPERSEGSKRVLGALCCVTHEHCYELRRDLPAATLPHPRTDCYAHLVDEQTRLYHTYPTKRLDCPRPTARFRRGAVK
jgi:hypothetical protein